MWEAVDGVHMFQVTDKKGAAVNTVMNLRLP